MIRGDLGGVDWQAHEGEQVSLVGELVIVDTFKLRERFAASAEGNDRDYSFVCRGQSGTLDCAFGTETLAAEVTGVARWHINADEPRALDYNQEYNPQPLYKPDPFRSSDHDPVLIGIVE